MINLFKKAEDINRVTVVGFAGTVEEESGGYHATLYKDQDCTDPFTADELMNLAVRRQITVEISRGGRTSFAIPTVYYIKSGDGACVLSIADGYDFINVHSSEYQPLGPE